MRVIVIGAAGMLGSDLVAELRGRGDEVTALDIPEIDITDPTSVAMSLQEGAAEWCVNCAAYTAVDRAETEREKAYAVNAIGPGYLAKACEMAGIRLAHLSTDFVFDGDAQNPYQENHPTNPLGYYGVSKRDGEEAVLASHSSAVIFRTAWLYGPNGPSFPRTMIRAWEAGKPLRVVNDQTGCPTFTSDLARTIAEVLNLQPQESILHTVGPESMSWRDFAERAIQAWKSATGSAQAVEVEGIPTEAYPTPAKRPKYSVLSTSLIQSLGVRAMPPVSDALARFIERAREIPDWPN
jgi:dTDP-4-dehydrorhamnose reductase